LDCIVHLVDIEMLLLDHRCRRWVHFPGAQNKCRAARRVTALGQPWKMKRKDSFSQTRKNKDSDSLLGYYEECHQMRTHSAFVGDARLRGEEWISADVDSASIKHICQEWKWQVSQLANWWVFQACTNEYPCCSIARPLFASRWIPRRRPMRQFLVWSFEWRNGHYQTHLECISSFSGNWGWKNAIERQRHEKLSDVFYRQSLIIFFGRLVCHRQPSERTESILSGIINTTPLLLNGWFNRRA
jgi:hypothetical protein